MDSEQKKLMWRNVGYRVLVFLGCFAVALLLALAAGAVAKYMESINEPAINAIGAIYLLTAHSQTILIFGIILAMGNRHPVWQYALFGFMIAILPLLFMNPLRDLLGPTYNVAVGCVNAVLAGGMRYGLVKLLDALTGRPNTK